MKAYSYYTPWKCTLEFLFRPFPFPVEFVCSWSSWVLSGRIVTCNRPTVIGYHIYFPCDNDENFVHKYSKHGLFLSNALTDPFIIPSLMCKGGSRTFEGQQDFHSRHFWILFFFLLKIDLLLWDVQMFTWISTKTVPDTSLHKTSDWI